MGECQSPCIYPHQIVSMDLTGPFARSAKGHTYLLTLIDHLTGWADAYPLASKKGEAIADVLHADYLPRYGAPEIIITDNGLEFCNSAVASLLKVSDVKHRTTTPYHPQSNAKVEWWHRTLKGIIERLMATSASGWEKQLGPALTAYRNTVSATTGYTPFQALYGRQARIPTARALRQGHESADVYADDRMASLARTWQQARDGLRRECETNEDLQRRKRLGKSLEVGDSVIVLIPGMCTTFKPRWDARWQVIRARHPVYWIRHLPTGREKVLHRDKLRWVPADIDWDIVPRTTEHFLAPGPTTLTLPVREAVSAISSLSDSPESSASHSPTLPLPGASATDVRSTDRHSDVSSPNNLDQSEFTQISDNNGLDEADQDDDESCSTADSNQIGEDRLCPAHDDNNAGPDHYIYRTAVAMTSDNSGTPAATENERTTAASDLELPDSEAPAGLRLRRYPRQKRKLPAYLGWYHNPYITKYGRFGVLDYWPYLAVQPPTLASCLGSGQFQMGWM